MSNDSVVSEKRNNSHCASYLNRCNSDTSIVLKKEKILPDCNSRIMNNSTNQEDYEGDCTSVTSVSKVRPFSMISLLFFCQSISKNISHNIALGFCFSFKEKKM